MKLKILCLLAIILACISSVTDSKDRIGQLKLFANIDLTYTQINQNNWMTALSKEREPEPCLAGAFSLFRSGKLATVFYAKDLNDPMASNILINEMEGYSKMQESLIPKIKAAFGKLNSIRWNKVTLTQTKNNIKCFHFSEYIDELNSQHTNTTYWLDDVNHRRWVAFSFNNVPNKEINSIINSVSFY